MVYQGNVLNVVKGPVILIRLYLVRSCKRHHRGMNATQRRDFHVTFRACMRGGFGAAALWISLIYQSYKLRIGVVGIIHDIRTKKDSLKNGIKSKNAMVALSILFKCHVLGQQRSTRNASVGSSHHL